MYLENMCYFKVQRYVNKWYVYKIKVVKILSLLFSWSFLKLP
ncbi:hypothetical protein SAMN05444369_10355 [Capnocytophaga haemolytica]|uniref:Uncharacterized protein n=1 Tax=Capnocytophaga haemolytica TaxID=45243 RepID=A0AAX2H2D7_9FLAO|nr:hypothetical protein SAMN05444369_10355 [Capnocytophaga haemolytica]SNV15815.1 Uncharacterised protein [Capnocytophaga haemolytica]